MYCTPVTKIESFIQVEKHFWMNFIHASDFCRILPKLKVGRDRAIFYFWQPNSLLALGTREPMAFIVSPRFLALKSVFGKILPKINVGTIPAKVEFWHNRAIFLTLAHAMVTHVAEWTATHTS